MVHHVLSRDTQKSPHVATTTPKKPEAMPSWRLTVLNQVEHNYFSACLLVSWVMPGSWLTGKRGSLGPQGGPNRRATTNVDDGAGAKAFPAASCSSGRASAGWWQLGCSSSVSPQASAMARPGGGSSKRTRAAVHSNQLSPSPPSGQLRGQLRVRKAMTTRGGTGAGVGGSCRAARKGFW